MVVTALDTHELFKRFTSVGFSDEQAEVLTALLRPGQDIGLFQLATSADVAMASPGTSALVVATRADIAKFKTDILTAMMIQTATIIVAIAEVVYLRVH